uniref:Uncharacterized protein n=1 Tax=Anguilla anguilla TaxID=7936 RepID=A0A0E9TK25_ANGAN
MVHRSKNWHF